MKRLLWLPAVLVLLAPGLALADDLELCFLASGGDGEFRWTLHDVEAGTLPATTVTTSSGERYRIRVEMEFTADDAVLLTFGVSTVLSEEGPDSANKTVTTKEKWLSSPRVQVPKGEEASIRQGEATRQGESASRFIEVHAAYVVTGNDGANPADE